MTTYADIYSNNGVAKIFSENFSTAFAALFDGNTAAEIDAFILHLYGDKVLLSKITAENAAAVIVSIIAVNLQTWQKIHSTLTAPYNALLDSDTKTKTGTLTRLNSTNTTQLNAEKAFNETEFTDSTRDLNTSAATDTDTYNLSETHTKTNADSVKNMFREIELRRKNNLQLQIIYTIINAISLSIY